MDFNKLYNLVVGTEIRDYNDVKGKQEASKVMSGQIHNPNAIYQVVKVENPSGCPMYTLANMSKKNDIIDMNFKTIQDAEVYALANKLKMQQGK